MSTTNGRTRERKQRPLKGVPIVAAFAPTPREDREAVRAWWQTQGRLALMSLSLAALAGCTEARADGGSIGGHVHNYTDRSASQYETSCTVDCDAAGKCRKGRHFCFKFYCADDGAWVYGSCGGCQ